MSLYVLDTDTLSLLQEGHTAVLAAVSNRAAVELAITVIAVVAAVSNRAAVELAITVIAVEEQLSGWYRMLRQAKNPSALSRVYDHLAATIRLLATLPILSFSETAIDKAKSLQGLKLNVRKMDLSIAAIALEHQAVVVTRNVRDFKRIPDLHVEDWSV